MSDALSAALHQIQEWLDPRALAAGGYVVITLVVCAETGLAMGIVMPGESLVLIAGMLAASGRLNLAVLVPCLFTAAVIGDAMGFAVGARLGPRIFTRSKSLFFRPQHLLRASRFYEKHGGKTIVLARFIPFVRTFAPIVAGATNMKYRQFAIYNVIGAMLWVCSILLLGYFLGKAIPDIESKLWYVILLVLVIAALVPAADLLKARLARRNEVEE